MHLLSSSFIFPHLFHYLPLTFPSLSRIVFITLFQTKDVIFKLSLEEDGVMTTCELASLYTEDFDEVINNFFGLR